jgi:L,D-transpeptidase catalytic domain
MRAGWWIAVALLAAGCGATGAAAPGGGGTAAHGPTPAANPARAGAPQRPPGRPAYLVAELGRPLATPFGTVAARTSFGQPVWVPVLRRGAHARALVPLGVRGRVVAVDLHGLRVTWDRARVLVDLSARRMTVRVAGRRASTFPIGEGGAATPTPTGRFAVTDRLTFPAGSPYAPFAVGLSAHQTRLAPGWPGGDQVAIHPGPLGPTSNGCIHAGPAAMRLLRRVAILGTLVVVRR